MNAYQPCKMANTCRNMKNKDTSKNRITIKKIYIAIFVFTVLSVIPVWYIGRYDVMSLDDYYFGTMTYHAWKQTHSLGAVISAAIEQMKYYYQTKQATYSSVFLMAVYPGVWNEKAYFLTPFIMSAMIIGSVTTFVHVVISDVMGMKRDLNRDYGYLTGIISCLLVFLIIQTLPVPLEGIFWYNGSLHYVFMQSVMIFEVAVILHGMHAGGGSERADKEINVENDPTAAGIRNKIKVKTQIWTLVLASVLGFIVGGGNLITGLQASILIAIHIGVMAIAYFTDKNSTGILSKLGIRSFKRAQLLYLIPEAVTVICFLINSTAPCNAKRQESVIQMNPVKAVIMSFYYGANHFVSWISPIMIVVLLVVAAIIVYLAGKGKAAGGRNYIHPVLFGIISLCVFAAMFTPTLYAMSEDAPSRVQNVIYIAEVLIIFLNIVNGVEYINKKCNAGDNYRNITQMISSCLPGLIISGCAVTLIFFLFAANKNTYTSISALRSLLNGEAERYYEQSFERFEIYNDDSRRDITIRTYSDDARPYLLFKEDVGNEGEEGYWQNSEIAHHYDKDTITVVK